MTDTKKIFDRIEADNAARLARIPQDVMNAGMAQAQALFADESRFAPVSMEALVSAQQRMFNAIEEYTLFRDAAWGARDRDAIVAEAEAKLVPIVKAECTKPMLRAIIRFHGSAQSSRESRTDARTIKALIDKGLLRWSSGKPNRKLYTLTPVGVVIYNHTTPEEAGL